MKRKKEHLELLANFRDGTKQILKCTRDRMNSYWDCSIEPIQERGKKTRRFRRK